VVKITKAIDIISANQIAVVLFTKGDKFSYDERGDGETGNWKINTGRLKKINMLIIYLRRPQESGGRIFMAKIVGSKQSSQSGRQVIQFTNLEEVGMTKSNWSKFAETGPSPVRYLNV